MELDVLGEPYFNRTIELASDPEGAVVATLVNRADPPQTGRAVLYVHGFSEYFFHTNVADFFQARGYAFYALDLRKAGRSLRPHQTPHFVRHIPEYFAELDAAARLVRQDGFESITVYAHSAGALAVTLWAHRIREQRWLSSLVLNSPFFALNTGPVAHKLLALPIDIAGLLFPRGWVPFRTPGHNVRSLHKDLDGEWDFDLRWKSPDGTPLYLGWLRGMDRAQRLLRRGLNIQVPVLVAAAGSSYLGGVWGPLAHTADSVLSADDIVRWAPRIGERVETVRIQGGRHDLALSQLPARKVFFDEIDAWLRAHDLVEEDWKTGEGIGTVVEPREC